MIKMQVIGHLGKDCIVNTVNGKNVINFTVAHTEKYRDSQGNNQEKTTWVDCGGAFCGGYDNYQETTESENTVTSADSSHVCTGGFFCESKYDHTGVGGCSR